MNMTYVRTARQSFLVLKEAEGCLEPYELKMIRCNDIPSLLPLQVILTDGVAEYWYDVTGLQSLEKQFSVDGMGVPQLKRLLRGILEMKGAMEEYLLDDANVSYAPTMVYYDRFTGRMRFCYVPGPIAEEEYSIRALFEEVLQYLQHDDAVATRVGYEMYERCVSAEFVAEDCSECLRMCDPQPEEELDLLPLDPVEEPMLPKEPIHRKNTRRKRKKEKKNLFNYSRSLPEEPKVMIAAEQLPPENAYTMHFSEDELEKKWELIYRGDGMEKNLLLEELPYWVGTDGAKAQGVLQSRTVSRLHAKLWEEDEVLYVEDFHSTNGTYVNETLLPMSTPTALKEGDLLVFATEKFIVSCRRTPYNR